MAKKKRVTRKQLLKEPDEFFTFSGRVIQFIAANQRPVLGVVIGVLVVALVYAGFRYFTGLSERKAYALFAQGLSHYASEIFGEKGAIHQKHASEQFEKVLRQYPSTHAAQLTLIVYADISYHKGEYEKTIGLYREALNSFAGDDTIEKLIWNGLAHAYEGNKDHQSAAEHYKKITDSQDNFMKGDAYYNLGRMMEALNHSEKALEAYSRVLEDHPESVGFQIAKDKVSRLKGVSKVSE